MSSVSTFAGFPREVIAFYEDLRQNNDRGWFQAHKADYDRYVTAPAQDFVRAMGERLPMLSLHFVADTRLNGSGSIFRIYRDTRFSKDKTPYKTFQGIYFWEGGRKKLENSGFYFHLEPPRVTLGSGIYILPRRFLDVYRDAVVDPEHGAALVRAVEQVTATGPYQIGGRHYKRIPRGYDPDHELADYLLFNGLYASCEGPIPEELYTAELVDWCFERFQDMYPIHQWVVAMMERGSGT